MALDTGPCEPWDLLCTDFPEGSEEFQEDAAWIATEVLWNRSKRQFGFCTVALRPCKKDCYPAWPWIPQTGWTQAGGTWPWPQPALVGGQWLNITCNSCVQACSCTFLERIQLPYPVAEVLEVRVDGEVLAPEAYRVDNYKHLTRIDGGRWPACNDLNLDADQPGTWEVTARYGTEVPRLGQLAAGELATEIVKRCVGANGCRLPSTTVQRIDRQGVTKILFDADTAFRSGKIGLLYPDLFVSTFNPLNTGTASIFNIDGARTERLGT